MEEADRELVGRYPRRIGSNHSAGPYSPPKSLHTSFSQRPCVSKVMPAFPESITTQFPNHPRTVAACPSWKRVATPARSMSWCTRRWTVRSDIPS